MQLRDKGSGKATNRPLLKASVTIVFWTIAVIWPLAINAAHFFGWRPTGLLSWVLDTRWLGRHSDPAPTVSIDIQPKDFPPAKLPSLSH
jgi:hypothetical protein